MNNIERAIIFATQAHEGQFRKYDGLPYITHPMEVMTLLPPGSSEEMLIAALLHDVVEDTEVGYLDIRIQFGYEVMSLVHSLTNEYTKENYPELNRAQRKALENVRLSQVEPGAQTIKYCDLISNTSSIAAYDPNFAVKYLEEKRQLLLVMKEGHKALLNVAWNQCLEAQKCLR